MMTIGSPQNMSDIAHYGDFDMAHLVIYFRELADTELSYQPKISLNARKKGDLDSCLKKKGKMIFQFNQFFFPRFPLSLYIASQTGFDFVYVILKYLKIIF